MGRGGKKCRIVVNSGQKWVAGPVDLQSALPTNPATEPPNFFNQPLGSPRAFF